MNFIFQVINGLQIGSIYALTALGYTMVYGIAKLINFAHGDILMIGAYVSYFTIPFLTSLGLPIYLSVIFSIIVCSILGVLIEKLAYKPLRNSPRISNLITAIGVSLLLENLIMTFVGTNSIPFPKVFNFKPINFGSLRISPSVLITILVTLVLTLLLQLFMKKTKYGTAMLATSEDMAASSLVGINVNKSISLAFVIGSALAAIGSLLFVASYPQISATMGLMLGIKAFIAAVIGGVGSIPGAVIGGLILGNVEALTKAYISTELGEAFVFGILILVLLFKPEGLFGKNIKEKV